MSPFLKTLMKVFDKAPEECIEFASATNKGDLWVAWIQLQIAAPKQMDALVKKYGDIEALIGLRSLDSEALKEKTEWTKCR